MQSKVKFQQNIKNLQSDLKIDNILAMPKMEKIVISIGIGKIRDKKEAVEKIIQNLKNISSQQPIITQAKKSVSGFKVREGEKIGLKVTLRGDRMWSFYDKLINTALPQIRDFQGFKRNSLDKQGNVSVGIKEHVIFPEISYDDIDVVHGLSATISIKSKNKKEAEKYLGAINFPFERN